MDRDFVINHDSQKFSQIHCEVIYRWRNFHCLRYWSKWERSIDIHYVSWWIMLHIYSIYCFRGINRFGLDRKKKKKEFTRGNNWLGYLVDIRNVPTIESVSSWSGVVSARTSSWNIFCSVFLSIVVEDVDAFSISSTCNWQDGSSLSDSNICWSSSALIVKSSFGQVNYW